MNYFYCLILLLIPLTFSYPRYQLNDFDDLLDMYLKRQSENTYEIDNANSNEQSIAQRQHMLHFPPVPYPHQPQFQPICLPPKWSCGLHLPPCCPGLMCYDANAKRGPHCVARR